MIEFAIGIALVVFLYWSKNIIKGWLFDVEDTMEQVIVERRVERQPELVKLDKRVEKLKADNGGQWVTLDQLIGKMS